MQVPRRRFVAMAVGVVAGFSSEPLRALADAKGSAVRLGGPIFLQSNDPAALAREHRRLGYSAAYCPEIATLHDERLLAEIQRAYAAENVVIAEVGAWKNMLDPEAGNAARTWPTSPSAARWLKPSARDAASTSPVRTIPIRGMALIRRISRRNFSTPRSRTAAISLTM